MLNKIKTFTLLITLLFGFQSFAQVHFGAKIGGTSSNLFGSNFSKFVPAQKTSFHIGGLACFEIAKKFSIQTELLYSGKGSPVSYENQNSVYSGSVTMNQRLGYFAIPVMAQLNFGSAVKNRVHIDVGIVGNWLIYNKFSGTLTYIDANNESKTKDFDYPLSLNKRDLSYAAGIGLVAGGISFDFRYEQGTSTIYSKSEGIPELRNRAFFVSLGYYFN